MEFTQRADFYLASPRGAIVEERRRVVYVDLANSTFTLGNHGFSTNDKLTLVLDSSDAVLPAPLQLATAYYAIATNMDSTFKLSATVDGPPITFIDEGVGFVAVVGDLGALIDRCMTYGEGQIQMQVSPESWAEIIAQPSVYLRTGVAKIAAREVYRYRNRNDKGIFDAATHFVSDLLAFGPRMVRKASSSTTTNNAEVWADDNPFDGPALL